MDEGAKVRFVAKESGYGDLVTKILFFPIPSVFLYSFLFHINVMFSYLVRYRYSMWSREEEGRIRFWNSGDLSMGKRGARTDEEFTPPPYNTEYLFGLQYSEMLATYYSTVL